MFQTLFFPVYNGFFKYEDRDKICEKVAESGVISQLQFTGYRQLSFLQSSENEVRRLYGRAVLTDYWRKLILLSDYVQKRLNRGERFLILGGDNSILPGIINGYNFLDVTLLYISDRPGLYLSSRERNLDRSVIATLLGIGDYQIYAGGRFSPLINREYMVIYGWQRAYKSEKRLFFKLGLFEFSLKKACSMGIARCGATIRELLSPLSRNILVHLDVNFFSGEDCLFSYVDNNEEGVLSRLRVLLDEVLTSFETVNWSLSNLDWESKEIEQLLERFLQFIGETW